MGQHRYSFFLPIALLALVSASLLAQARAQQSSSQQPVIKSRVNAVLVDVVVTNSKGEPVPGLQKEDFEIFEDAKAQTIVSFEEHHGAQSSPVRLPTLPPHVYTNFPLKPTTDSVNVLLLDALNTPLRDQSYVHGEMIKYLKAIPPGTRVAIFTLASRLNMLQGVTTDSSELLAILNNAKAGPQQSALLPSQTETDVNQRLVDFMSENTNALPPESLTLTQAQVDSVSVMKQFLADTATFQTESRIRLTLQALDQLGRYLSGIPGRKNLIWFSGSFPLSVFPDPDVPDPYITARKFQDEVRKTADLLTAAQVAIYPIGAEGLAPDSTFAANGAEIGQKRGITAMQDQMVQSRSAAAERDSNHVSMEELAKQTGGQAFYNTNGLNDALTRVMNNGTHYYSLTYSPENSATDGKYRRIQLKVPNGKYALAYRRGYYADTPESARAGGQKPDSDPLVMLMGRNLPDYSDILYKIRVLPMDPQPDPTAARIGSNTDFKGTFVRYAVDFAITVQDLKFETAPDGTQRGAIEVCLIAFDRGGKAINFVVDQGNMKLQPKVYADLQQGGLQVHKEIDVPVGYTFLRTGIYDLNSHKAGTLGIPLNNGMAAKAAK
jgi:VWFA-related protein